MPAHSGCYTFSIFLLRFGSEKPKKQAFSGSVKHAWAKYSTPPKSLALALRLGSKAPDIARIGLSLNFICIDEMRQGQPLGQGGRGSV